MSILVLNAGSSTLKFVLFDDKAQNELASGSVDWRGTCNTASLLFRSITVGEEQFTQEIVDYGDAVNWILKCLAANELNEPIRIVGHRVVHGGTQFCQTSLIDDQVIQSLEEISQLAPLHNPPALKTMATTQRALPASTQVAVFDTAFFADLPERSAIYPLPYAWHDLYGIRRFGFHGISHSYCTTRAAELLKRQNDDSLRLVICHLGNGCSATAVRGNKPVATTMGFTPMEGLMMGTRAGSIDPGILLYLLQQHDISATELDESLNRHSGLLGVSGISSDFRDVELAAHAGNQRACLAIEMFIDRVRSTIGSLAVSLGGIDGLIFTAGIGENSSSLRSRVCKGLACLGLYLDEDKNQNSQTDSDIAIAQSSGKILKIQTREELMIAREAHSLLTSPD